MILERFFRREPIKQKSVLIEYELYQKMSYISEKIYFASASEIAHACMVDILETKRYREGKEYCSLEKHPIMFRMYTLEKLKKEAKKQGKYFYEIFNDAIKNVIEDYENEFGEIKLK